MAIDTSRFKVPAGSLVVDFTLVLALLWGGARMTERLEQIGHRVDAIEETAIRTNTDGRVQVLERRAEEQAEFKREVRDQLNRIEDKLDQIAAAKRK